MIRSGVPLIEPRLALPGVPEEPVNREWLYQRYVVDGLGTYAIAKLVKRDPKTVYRWLCVFDIPIRARKWENTPGRLPFHDRDWLVSEYIGQERSAQEIADEFRVTAANVYHFLRLHGIRRRTTTEARDAKHWSSPGDKNPMYGMTGDLNPNWKGGIAPERQTFYSSSVWKETETIVRERDDSTCQRCRLIHDGSARVFAVHHIVPFSFKPLRATLTNLVLLCSKCHSWVHSKANAHREFRRSVEGALADERRG